MPLLGGRPVPGQRLVAVRLRAATLLVTDAEHVLRIDIAGVRTQAEPGERDLFVARHARALLVHERETVARGGVLPFRRDAVELDRRLVVLFHPVAGLEYPGEPVTRVDMLLLGGLPVPFGGLGHVAFDTAALVVDRPESEIGGRILRRRGEFVPFRRGRIALLGAKALFADHAEVEQRLGVALIGGGSVPAQRLAMVLFDALALGIHDAEVHLGLGGAVFGERPPFFEGGGEVPAVVGEEPVLEARLCRALWLFFGGRHGDLQHPRNLVNLCTICVNFRITAGGGPADPDEGAAGRPVSAPPRGLWGAPWGVVPPAGNTKDQR